MTIKSISKDLLKQILKVSIMSICILSLFVLFNILFIVLKNIEYYRLGDFSYIRLILQILMGLVFVIWCLFMIRSYIWVNIVAVIYKHLTPFFKKLCTIIIDKVYNKTLNLSNTKHISKALDVGNVLKNSYTNKIPRIIQRSINFLINQIPFADFILNIQKEMKIENNQDVDDKVMSAKLYEQTDLYIRNSIINNTNLYWIFWLFPINIIVQFGFDYFFRIEFLNYYRIQIFMYD